MTNIDPTKARQGRKGSRVLIVLVAGLVLAVIAFLGMGMFGASEPDQQIGGEGQTGVSTSPAAPANSTGGAPTVTPGSANTNTQ